MDSRCTDYKGQVGLRGMGGTQQHGRGSAAWEGHLPFRGSFRKEGGGGYNKKAVEHAQEAVEGIPLHLREELTGFARFQGLLGPKRLLLSCPTQGLGLLQGALGYSEMTFSSQH